MKTGDSERNLGFESLTLRQKKCRPRAAIFYGEKLRDSKGRPDRREGKKVSGGHFFSPWENPYPYERTQYGCGHEDIIR